MARVNASGFKMKQSPVKGKLGDFFSGLGRKGTEERQTKQREENEGGLTNFEKRRAEKKSRKTGESKFKADIRRGKERRAKEKVAKADKPKKESQTVDLTKKNKSVVEIPASFEGSNKGQFLKESLTLTPPSFTPSKSKTITEKDKRPSGSSDSYQKKHGTGKYAKNIVNSSDDSTGEGFTVHNPGRKREAGKKPFGIRPPATLTFSTNSEADAYITENKGSFLKKSGFKMKNSPARNYKKGYYGVK